MEDDRPDDTAADVIPEVQPAEHGDQPGEDTSVAASRESMAAVSVRDSRGFQIGDGNLQVNISVEGFDWLERSAPSTAALALLLASLAPGLVPLNLLLATGDAPWPQGPEAARALGRLPHGQVAIKEVVAELGGYALAARAGNGLVEMPGPARDFLTRTRLASKAQATPWRQAAAGLVAAAIAAVGESPDARPDWAALLPHARAVLDLTSDGIWQLALSLARSGRYAMARDLCALIIDAYRDSGDDGPGYQAASRKIIEWTRLAANKD